MGHEHYSEGGACACSVCRKALHAENAELRTVCSSCVGRTKVKHSVGKVKTNKERKETNGLICLISSVKAITPMLGPAMRPDICCISKKTSESMIEL